MTASSPGPQVSPEIHHAWLSRARVPELLLEAGLAAGAEFATKVDAVRQGLEQRESTAIKLNGYYRWFAERMVSRLLGETPESDASRMKKRETVGRHLLHFIDFIYGIPDGPSSDRWFLALDRQWLHERWGYRQGWEQSPTVEATLTLLQVKADLDLPGPRPPAHLRGFPYDDFGAFAQSHDFHAPDLEPHEIISMARALHTGERILRHSTLTPQLPDLLGA